MITIQQNITVHKYLYSDLHSVLDKIRTGGTLTGKITELRILPEAEYKDQKKTMPGIIFQGKFTKREKGSMERASGLMVLDFDHCGTDFKKTLSELDWIYVIFVSLGGDGIKALVKIPEVKTDEEYKQYFEAVSDELEKTVPKALDQSGKDICRLCFFSYDPELYINPEARIWTKKKEKGTLKTEAKYVKNDYRRAMTPLNYIRNSEQGERHTRILKAARLMGGYTAAGVISEEEGLRLLKQEAYAVAPEDYQENLRAIVDGMNHGKQDPVYEILEKEINTEEKYGKLYFTEKDVDEKIEEKYKNGLSRGYFVGWDELDKYWTLKLGTTLYVYGAPYSGKTQIWYEILINTSKFYDFKHVIFSPETGGADDIFIELMQIYAGRDFYRDYNNEMTPAQKDEAKTFLDKHFIVVDPSEELITIDDFYNYVDIIERKYNVKIHTTTVDPWNELRHDLDKHNARDIYLEWALGKIRQNARVNNRLNCIITHITQQQQAKGENGKMYYPAASFREVAGGQSWARKGMGMISVYRPSEGLKDDTGRPYEPNTTLLLVQKVKPKGSGMKGTAVLYYDLKQHRYYEGLSDFIYAHEKKVSPPDEIKYHWSEVPDEIEFGSIQDKDVF
jgi:hypothetical protein